MKRNRTLAAALAALAAGGVLAGAAAAAPSRTPEVRFPEGIFRGKMTAEDVRRVWPGAPAIELKHDVGTLTLRFSRGAFSGVLSNGGVAGCRHADGRYAVQEQYVVVTVTDVHGCTAGVQDLMQKPLKLHWSYDGKLLRFQVPRSALLLERVIWSAIPYVRIG